MGFYGILIISVIASAIVISSGIGVIQNLNMRGVNGFDTYRSIVRVETFENIVNYIHASNPAESWSGTLQLAYPYSYGYYVNIHETGNGFVLSSGINPTVYYWS